MEKYIITSDAICDLSAEIRNHFGITSYSGGYIHISDGRDFRATLDWGNISREDFYSALSNKKLEITTSPWSPDEYFQFYEKYILEGYSILGIYASSEVSSTYSVSCVAAERIRQKYPDAVIKCIDSSKMSGAFGLLVAYANKLKNEGKTLNEVADWIEDNKFKVHQMGPIDDLMFVARRGRISMGKAIMGSFAGVKPMGDCNHEGYVSVLTKVKGIKKALDVTVKYIEKTAINIEDQFIIISHSNRETYANTLKTMIEDILKPEKVFVSDCFPISGANIGPGMLGVYYLGDESSTDMSVEKAVMDSVLSEMK